MQPFMQKFRTWSVPAALAAAVLLSSCGDKERDPLEVIRSHAPADTVFYIETRLDSEISYEDPLLMSRLEIMLAEMLDAGTIDDENYEQIRQGIIQYMSAFVGDSQELAEKMGIAEDMLSAFYFDGLYPVTQFAVLDGGEKLKLAVNQAAKQYDVELAIENIENQAVTVWSLPELEGATFTLQLAFVVKDDIASIALITDKLTLARKAEILGLVDEDESVASAELAQELYSNYELEQMVGYINLVELSNVLTNPSESTLAQDLDKGLQGEGSSLVEVSSEVSAQCKLESKQIVESVPRLVFGTTSIESTDEQYQMDFRYVLELKNTALLNSLIALNGHLPSFVAEAEKHADTLLAMSIGLDAQGFKEAMQAASSYDMAEHFSCSELAEMENPFADPTILQALAMPTVDTIKGIGLALYDFNFDEASFDISLDGLVTLATDDPMSLVSTAKLFLPIPSLYDLEEGTTVDLELPIPLPLDIKASVQGNHIGIFSGEKAAQAFAEEAETELNSDGILAVYADASKVSQLAKSLGFLDSMSYSSSSCADAYLMEYSFEGTGGKVDYRDRFTEQGFQMDYQMAVNRTSDVMVGEFNPLGEYRVSSQDEGCDWYVFGEEELSDNIGYYDYFDEPSDQCGLSRYTYNWSFDGMRLSFVETTALTRADCSADWVVDTSYTDEDFASYSCIVTKYDDTSFECVMFNGDTTKDLYRYERM